MLVSEFFDGVPWLERVYQAGALWDAAEMGAEADVHCYTPAELGRKREALRPRSRSRRARRRRSSSPTLADRDHALDRDARA